MKNIIIIGLIVLMLASIVVALTPERVQKDRLEYV